MVARACRRRRWAILSAAVAGALAGTGSAPAQLQWDPGFTPATPSGGPGTWDATTANWSDGANDVPWDGNVAVFGGTVGTGAVAVGAGIGATGLTFDVGGYTLAGAGIGLTGAGPTVAFNAGTTTITSILSGANATLTGATGAVLSLGGVNTLTGTTAITAGTVTLTNPNALGTTSTNATVAAGAVLNTNFAAGAGTLQHDVTLGGAGATLRHTSANQLNFVAGRSLAVNGTGNVVDVVAGASAGVLPLGTGDLVGAGSFTKQGAGLLSITGDNPGFSGSVTVSGGQLDLRHAQALGTTPDAVTVTAGELTLGNVAYAGAVNATGGTLSGNSGNSTYNGPISVANTVQFGLRDFSNTATPRTLTVNGPVTGSGTIAAVGATAGGGVLVLNSNLSGFNGSVSAGANTTVQLNAPLTGGSVGVGFSGAGTTQLRAANVATLATPPANLGAAGLTATYYNFGTNQATNSVQFATDQLYQAPRAFTRTDQQINIPVSAQPTYPIVPVPGYAIGGPGGANEGIMWKGVLKVDTAGSYQFSGTNDDALVLIVDGVQVGTLGVIATNTNIGAALNLSAGYHSIVVKHTQGGGGGYATVSYSGADTGGTPAIVGSLPNTVFNGALDPQALGAITVSGGTGTLDLGTDASATALNFTAANQTWNLTSATISRLTVAGGSLNGGTSTINNTTADLVFTGGISQVAANSALTFPSTAFRTTFQAPNSYTGLTTVSGGQLVLDAQGGDAIAGNLTVSTANTGGLVSNVLLARANQIADTANVTLSSFGVLDLGAHDETIGTLTLNGSGLVAGTGTLTASTFTLNTGIVLANLAGATGTTGITKNSAGTVVLAGPSNTYGGQTLVQQGAVNVRGNLGAAGLAGSGADTVVSAGAQLQFQGATVGAEDVTVTGTGLGGTGAVRVTGGASTLGGSIILAGPGTIEASAGSLSVAGGIGTGGNALTVQGGGDLTVSNVAGGGAVTKTGPGTLTFTTNQSSLPGTWTGGTLGFTGPQSFGAVNVPAGQALRFNADPGAGAAATANGTARVIAGYAVDQALVSRVAAGSTGTLALAVNSASALDLSARPDLKLGAVGLVTYSGSLIAPAGGFNLGGGADPSGTGTAGVGTLTVSSVLGDATGVNVHGDVRLTAANTFAGAVSLNPGGLLRVHGNDALGNVTQAVTLDGGTLQINQTSGNAGAIFYQSGNGVGPNNANRGISVGAAGGTIDVPTFLLSGTSQTAATINSTDAITGTGPLTKAGYGFLILTGANTSYGGTLTVAPQGGQLDLRGGGTLLNVAAVNVDQSGQLNVDHQNGMGGSRQGGAFAGQFIANRLRDTAPVTLAGGSILFTPRAAAGQISETFGPLVLGVGQSAVNATSNITNNQGAVLKFNNANTAGATPSLSRVTGGTIRFGGNAGTFGVGAAASVDTPGAGNTQVHFLGMPDTAILPYASIFGTDFARYTQPGAGAALNAHGISIATYTAQGAAAFTPAAGNIYNLNAAGTATLNAGDAEMLALRFGSGNNAQVLAFNAAAQKLAIGSGGIIHDNNNQNRDIGATATRGVLTAGPLTGNAAARELFLHSTNGNLRVFSQIVDNNGFAVSVVKDLDGTATLDATNNNYTGGTYVTRGTLAATGASSLGQGPVTVKNARLNINAAGAVAAASAAGGYTITDQGEIFLGNNTANFNTTWDRFTVEAGGTIIGSNAFAANQSLNSLTRVPTLTGGGQVVLQPGAIVGHQFLNSNDANGTGTATIQNLGTSADLFWGLSANLNNQLASLSVGAGTPWRGISTDRTSRTWQGGTIVANSDFFLQGLARDGSHAVLTLGGNGAPGTYAIVNNAARPLNAYVNGIVALDEDSPVNLPNDLTFVVTTGSVLQPNRPASLNGNYAPGVGGTGAARVLVQAGGTLDPGNFVLLGAAANTNRNPDGSLNNTQNLPYPAPSPLNGPVTVEAAGRFLINDASGIGSAPDGLWTMKAASVLELGTANAFFGRGDYALSPVGTPDTTGVIRDGQFSFEDGAVVRLNVDNVYRLSQFTGVNAGSNGTVYEVVGNNRTLTNQVNPFVIAAVGTPLVAPEDVMVGAGMVTNDSADRQVSEGRGRLFLGDGATLAATTQTYLLVQEGIHVAPNATINIGSAATVDGVSKLGGVQFNAPNSNVIPATSGANVLDGAQLVFSNVNVWSDGASINLSGSPVTAFPSPGASSPLFGNGSSLLLNVANFAEVVGPITGTGSVVSNQAGAYVVSNASADYATDVVFKTGNGQNVNLGKTGAGTMTLGAVSDSVGEASVLGGGVRLAGAGSTAFGTWRVAKGGTLTLDNSAAAGGPLNNRLQVKSVAPQGGTVAVVGNASTAVAENINALFNSSGSAGPFTNNAGYSYLNLTPGGAHTLVQVNTLERFDNTGTQFQRSGTWVLRSPAIGNAPGTYSTTGVYTANPAVTSNNGMIAATAPNFFGNGGYGQGAVPGVPLAAGSALMPVRGDYLGDASPTGQGTGFVTQEAVTYSTTLNVGTPNVTLASTVGLVEGMAVTGTNVPGGTRILSVDSATDITLSNSTLNASGAQNLTYYGGMRLLAAGEFGPRGWNNVATSINVRATGTTVNDYTGDARVATLTLAPGATVNVGGTLPNNSTPSRLNVSGAGVFVQAGGPAATINAAPGTFLTTNAISGGSSLFLHAQGDLNLNARVYSDNAVVKTNAGALNVGPGAFTAFRGSLQVDDGTVTLAAGNAFSTIRGQSGFTSNNNLFVNGGTLNLGGNSQVINTLGNSNAETPGAGGLVTSPIAATLTVLGGGAFSGSIGGSVALDKTANNTLALTSTNAYAGTTLVRNGTLTLRSQGALTGSQQLDLNYATLNLDNGYLANVANRVSPTATVNMRGATVSMSGAAGQVATQTYAALNLLAGRNDFNNFAGGGGANVVTIENLNRPQGPNGGGAFTNVSQNFGFLGTAGNTTTAIRYFIDELNGAPLSTNDGIVAGWAVYQGDHFLTYSASTGLGIISNTNDGYRNYDSTDLTAAAATHNVNDGTSRTIAASKTVNSLRMAPGGAQTMALNAGVVLTLDTGGLLTNANQNIAVTGTATSGLTSNSGELDVWVNQGTTTLSVPVTGNIDLVKSGPAALTLSPPAGAANTHAGRTIANGGTLNLSMAGANAGSLVSVPGDLFINNATVTETIANQLTAGANVTVTGAGRFNLVNAAGVTETLASVTAFDAGAGGTGQATLLDRTANQPSSLVNLTAATPITATNTNPSAFPFIGANAGQVGFVRPAGQASTLQVNSPLSTGVNSGNGLNAVGLRVDAQIAGVPTGVADGGLVKAGTGLLVLNPTNTVAVASSTTVAGNATVTAPSTTGLVVGMPVTGTGIPTGAVVTGVTANSYTLSMPATAAGTVAVTGQLLNFNAVTLANNGTTSTQTPTFNVSQGAVRADQNGALGSPSALTTVQSGAVLLGSNTANAALVGSVRLNDGASLGATLNSVAFGALANSQLNQSVMQIVPGAQGVTVYAADYFVQSTNGATVTVNGRLTGSGNVNVVGPQMTSATGTLLLANPIARAEGGAANGGNDFGGTFNVGANVILQSQPAVVAPATFVSGSALGDATINLAGGRLRIRDEGDNTTAAQAIAYGNDVTLSANSFLDVNRVGATAQNKTIDLGTLTIATGTSALTVDHVNGYVARFATLAGTGTLVKNGTGLMTITAIDPGFTGGVRVPGAVDVATRAYANFGGGNGPNNWGLTLPAGAPLPNFGVDGIYHATSAPAALTVTGTLDVGDNAGTIVNGPAGVTTGSSTGALLVQNTVPVQAQVLRNDGVIAATGGATTLAKPAASGTPMTIAGRGVFQATGAALVLNGNLADAGPTATRLRVAGGPAAATDTVTLNTTGGANTGGAEVQSGTLVVTGGSSANPLGNPTAGNIRVLGYPVQTVGTGNAAPVNVAAPTLNFDPGAASTVTQAGDIQNSGVVRVSTGSVSLAGRVAGPGTDQSKLFVPGLIEGYVAGAGGAAFDTVAGSATTGTARPANPGNFGVKLEPRMLQNANVTGNALTGHLDNELWVYTGQVFDADGKFSFAGIQDDRFLVYVDGKKVLIANTIALSGTAATTGGNAGPDAGTVNFGMGPSGDGWHSVEIRMGNGGGGAGSTSTANGMGINYGLGFSPEGVAALNGQAYVRPIDDGSGNLFRTPLSAKGDVAVASAASLSVDGFNDVRAVTFGNAAAGGPTGDALLAVTNAASGAPSDADAFVVSTNSTGTSIVQLAAAGVANVGTTVITATDVMNVPASKVLRFAGGTGSVFRVGAAGTVATALLNGTLDVTGGLTIVNAAAGAGTTGSVTVQTGGSVGGTGTITGALTTISSGAAASQNGRVAPGELNAAGRLGVRLAGTQAVTIADNSGLDYNLATPNAPTPGADGTGNDLLILTGATAATASLVLGENVTVDVAEPVLAAGRYDLISFLSTVDQPALGAGGRYATWGLTVGGTPVPSDPATYGFFNDGQYVYLDVLQPVPEPATALGAVGLAAAGLLARRRRRGTR